MEPCLLRNRISPHWFFALFICNLARHRLIESSVYNLHSEESLGFIVDTPGLRGFGLVDLKKEEIALYFPEMLKASENCRFTPCTHTHEPGCAVKEAVEAGEISYDRYSSYLGMLDEENKYR